MSLKTFAEGEFMSRPSPKLRASGSDAQSERAALKRRATINDIARLADVSKKTVSRVINQSPFVKEDTRNRIHEIMRELGYVPDPQARGLAFRRSFLIGLVYDNPNAQFVVNAQQGVLDGVRGSGFEIVLHPCDRLAKNFLEDVVSFVERQKLYGVVLLPPVSENNKLVDLLKERGVHYVRVASAVIDEPSNLIVSNDRLATSEAATHLAMLGHKRIGFVSGPPGFRSGRERAEGFIDGLKTHGIAVPDDLIVQGAYTYESGIAAAQILLNRKPRPTAIFASNDEMAAGVYEAARKLKIAIPQELSIVGFDDAPVSSRLWPPLTTVRWPLVDMGRAAAEKLLRAESSAGPTAEDARPFQAHLVVRESTAPA